ncbi:TPA: hypothetical protein EYN98_05190 [Candidatus Poribacteria bacterium]|nr:hypothetical protein [Candidatus Poribacteria bacterium]
MIVVEGLKIGLLDSRPAVVDRRNRIGDWEGDTIIGQERKSTLLTMVAAKDLYTVVAGFSAKQADELAQAAIEHRQPLKSKVKTITF